MGKEDLVKEDLPFEVPKFNEDEFVRKELISFRTTAILFVWSLLIAIVTFAYWKVVWLGKDLAAGEFFLLVVFCVATGFALPFLYRLLRIDIQHFRRKEWFGTVFMHFIFWLGFTLLLANPPFNDNAAPAIEAYASPAAQGVGRQVELAAYVGDNEGLDASKLRFCVIGPFPNLPQGQSRQDQFTDATCEPWRAVPGQPVWNRTWTPTAAGQYLFHVEACDTNGKCASRDGTINVTNPFPVIDGRSELSSLSDRVSVKPDPGLHLRAVQYWVDGKGPYNMVAPTSEFGYWTTDPRYPGWHTGTNNVTFTAIEQPRYLHGYKLAGGRVESANASRTFNVVNNFPDLNSQNEPRFDETPPPNLVGTPGFEAPLVVAAIGVSAFLLVRRRRHDRA